jgi:2-polyprenyl-3-methyl-5-hydroxy-6-metoxy-1,4-benzoquinol methylase
MNTGKDRCLEPSSNATFKKNSAFNAIESVPGDYQYKATYEGRISQRLWHLQKHALLKQYITGKKFRDICDAGCGSGVLAAVVASWDVNYRVVGYDINQSSLEFARKRYAGIPNVRFIERDLYASTADGVGEFDFIYSMEVIEHFSKSDVPGYLKNLYSMGRTGCRYLITTPDYSSLWPLIEWSLDFFRLTPRLSDHQHLCKFTKKSIAATLEENGFVVLDEYNFCGLSPFIGHISERLAGLYDSFEHTLKVGNLVCCEFEKR